MAEATPKLLIQIPTGPHIPSVRPLLILLTTLALQAQPYATNLNNPRGLAFGNGNQLFVAEAGTGGANDTIGICPEQVPFPLGPLTGGLTGRVSRITPSGNRQTVTEGLPSTQTSALTGREVFGVTAVATHGNDVYVLVAAGCTKGNLNQPSALYKIEPNGKRTRIADLSAYYRAHPPAVLDTDHDPDGVPYALLRKNGDWYILNANHGVLDKVASNGTITRVTDLTPLYGHITPTTMAEGKDGNIYIANVGRVPHLDGQSILIKIDPTGAATTAATGLTSVLGLAVDCRGQFYALETATGSTGAPPFFAKNTGRVVTLNNGTRTPIATGLNMPTGMTIGPNGNLFISHRGHGFSNLPGQGEIITLPLQGCR